MIFKIALKNTFHKPLNTMLCLGLLAMGIGIITVILKIQHQIEDKMSRNLDHVDLVIGAKGSPLQLVLSSVFHVDAPTGNIKFSEAKKIMSNPMLKNAIPLAYGDTHLGYRILGTTTTYFNNYNGDIENGRFFNAPMEVVLGANVARKTGLKLHQSFVGTHGTVKDDAHSHDEHPYKIVGILKPTKTVLDDLIVTPLESVWDVHTEAEEDEHDEHAHEEHNEKHEAETNEDDHDSHDDHEDTHTEHKEITALLLNCKSKRSILTMPQLINQQTAMQAVIPALEINKLAYILGVGAQTINFIAGAIITMAGFSLFFIVYQRLNERKYELALLRSVGYRPLHLFALLVSEGIILAVLGYCLGWLLSRIGLYFINVQSANDFHITFNYGMHTNDYVLLLCAIALGIIASSIPAILAMRMQISSILSEN